MAKGTSGRVVIEIDPELKEELYSALGKDGTNLKTWFVKNVGTYLRGRAQLHLTLPVQGDQKDHMNK